MSAGDLSKFPLFAANLAAWEDRPALLLPGTRTISYRDLAERVDRQASHWRGERGLVMLEADLSEHAIVAYLAALKAGHAIAIQGPGTPDRKFLEPDFAIAVVMADGGRNV